MGRGKVLGLLEKLLEPKAGDHVYSDFILQAGLFAYSYSNRARQKGIRSKHNRALLETMKKTEIIRTFSLALVLLGLWLLLSGRYDLLYLCLGAVSVTVVIVIVKRMDVLDAESHAVSMIPCVLGYWMWLYRRIVRSNLDVVRRIVDPKLPISPTVVRVNADQSTDLCRVVYANSITLTPGTVFIDLEGDQIIVHSLTREAAEELERGEMNRLVCNIEEKL